MEESENHWLGEVGHHRVHQGDANHLVTQDVAAVLILQKEVVTQQEGRGPRGEVLCLSFVLQLIFGAPNISEAGTDAGTPIVPHGVGITWNMAWLLMSTRSTLCSTTSSSFFFAITNRLLGRSTANPCTSLLSCKDRPTGMELGWMLAHCFEPFRGNGDEWGA